MGSLISKPKAPPAPKPVIISSPVTVPVSTTSPSETMAEDVNEDTSSTSDAGEPENNSEAQTQDSREIRSTNLLRRNRGRGGTILTSFRGVLNKRHLDSPRKTLLGE